MLTRREIGWQPPGSSTVAYLDSFGLLSPRTLLVHGAQFSASDRNIMARTRAAWAHCPKSNAKLGNGIAPLGLMRTAYGEEPPRIGLGSDSVASNNTMDLFEEMRFTVLAQRGRTRRYNALTARQAVEMATIDGARALGLDSQIGSLQPEKQADLTAVSLDAIHASPCYDPYNALVYASCARDVTLTMVGGETIYDRGVFPKVDLAPVHERFQAAANKMRCWSPPE
jgi:5-methylthioadenosine/S-adenosylhomocysteine deaminase